MEIHGHTGSYKTGKKRKEKFRARQTESSGAGDVEK